MTADAVVVGGGIVGCACAYYLSLELERVLLVEPGPIGGGTTATGMGHVVVMDDSPAQFALTHYSQSLWDGLAGEMPRSAERELAGTLWVAVDDEEMAHVHQKAAVYSSNGVEVEVIDGAEVARLEPSLKPGLAGALRVPGDSIVFPMPAAGWMWDRAKEKGAGRRVGRAMSISPGAVRLDNGETLESPLIVNATGDHAPELTPGLPIEPRKGHLAITDRYPGYVGHQLVELGYLKSAHTMETESVAFNVQPRATGQLLIGSSRQFVGWQPGVEPRVLSKMLARAMQFMPGLGRLHVTRTWTGFRAATPDKLPLIGPWGPQPGVWIAAGHEGLGITTSTGTGQILADIVLGRTPAIDPAPYDPNRRINAH